MAYSSYGKKVYASIKDLPQYTSISNGDKVIIWNETRDGAAVVDFADFMIDLEHTTFKSTIGEVITLANDIQAFVYTVNENIESIQENIEKTESTINNELRARLKALEFIVATILGANTYWSSSNGIEVLKERFITEGITQIEPDLMIDTDNEEVKNAYKWYAGFMNAVRELIAKSVPVVEESDILLQSKFRYRYNGTNVSDGTSSENTGINPTAYALKEVVTTMVSSSPGEDGSDKTSTTTTTTKFNY